MTTDELTMIVEELGLEPTKKFDLLERISAQGVTDTLRDEVEQLVKSKVELTQQQHDLIEQAIAEVAKTDAESAKLAGETENELMEYEKKAMEDLDKLLASGSAVSSTPAPAN
jgi:DNA-binding MarR family transcriptional regulator